MKIVIDIDKRIYEHAKLREIEGSGSVYSQIIANGTPLPKGHGDLIDRDALIQKQFIPNVGFELVDLDDLKTAPTVIPAESEED